MKAIDTNILVRFVLQDDPDQYDRARAAIEGGVFLPVTVILESAWLLQSRYSLDRDAIADLFRTIIATETISVPDPDMIHWALDRYQAGGDFADMLHVAASNSASAFLTFDRKLARSAGRHSPIPVETLSS